MMKKKDTSEFGKGFIYNLVLFAKHWMMLRGELGNMKEVLGYEKWDLWFNGASDHFYELEIPPQWEKKKIGKLAKKLQKRSLYLGHGFKETATRKDFEKAFEDLEELCMLIDKELGIEPVKAHWN